MTTTEAEQPPIDSNDIWHAVGRIEGWLDALENGQREISHRIDRLEQRIETGQREISQRIDRLTITFIGSVTVLAATMIGAIMGSRFIE